MHACPKLPTLEKLFIILGSGTTSIISPILHSYYTLHIFPGYIPTHLVGQYTKEVGANEVGHTGRQESKTCRKTQF